MDLKTSRIAILGLGLMGGSLALALRDQCALLLGVDPDPAALSLAIERQVVDRVSPDPATLLPQADVVILAAPVRTIITLLHKLPSQHPGEAIVLDLGSTKSQIVAAMDALPPRFDPIGGHPMCGKEKSTLANADPRLFENAAFALTPLPRSTPRARRLAEQLVAAIGARPLWLDPQTHDRWTAATSHLPHLLSSALALATPSEVAPLISTGFLSATRLALASPEMMRDILITNRRNVLEALERFRRQLDQLEDQLNDDDFHALGDTLALGVAHRKELTGDKAIGQ